MALPTPRCLSCGFRRQETYSPADYASLPSAVRTRTHPRGPTAPGAVAAQVAFGHPLPHELPPIKVAVPNGPSQSRASSRTARTRVGQQGARIHTCAKLGVAQNPHRTLGPGRAATPRRGGALKRVKLGPQPSIFGTSRRSAIADSRALKARPLGPGYSRVKQLSPQSIKGGI